MRTTHFIIPPLIEPCQCINAIQTDSNGKFRLKFQSDPITDGTQSTSNYKTIECMINCSIFKAFSLTLFHTIFALFKISSDKQSII